MPLPRVPVRFRPSAVWGGLALAAGLLGGLAAGCASETLVARTTRPVPAQPAAVRVPESAVRRETVTYTPAGWPEALEADLYIPPPAGAGALRPAVLMIHGGGWVGGTRAEMSGYGRLTGPLAERGFVVMNVSYRLAPRWRDPAARQDLLQALAYLRANAARLGVDPARIGAWGYSAGAHLALLLAEDVRDKNLPPLGAVVAGGTPVDLTAYPDSPLVRQYLGTEYPADGARWREASPLHRVDARLPPVMLYHGTWDLTVRADNATRFAARLTEAGVPNELVWVQGAGHVATFLFGRAAVEQGFGFLDRYLRGPAGASAGAGPGSGGAFAGGPAAP